MHSVHAVAAAACCRASLCLEQCNASCRSQGNMQTEEASCPQHHCFASCGASPASAAAAAAADAAAADAAAGTVARTAACASPCSMMGAICAVQIRCRLQTPVSGFLACPGPCPTISYHHRYTVHDLVSPTGELTIWPEEGAKDCAASCCSSDLSSSMSYASTSSRSSVPSGAASAACAAAAESAHSQHQASDTFFQKLSRIIKTIMQHFITVRPVYPIMYCSACSRCGSRCRGCHLWRARRLPGRRTGRWR